MPNQLQSTKRRIKVVIERLSGPRSPAAVHPHEAIDVLADAVVGRWRPSRGSDLVAAILEKLAFGEFDGREVVES